MDEIEISFEKDIIFVLKKNIIFILIMALVGSCGAFFYTRYFVEKKYTTSISLYVDTSSENGEKVYNSSGDLSAYNYAQKLVATYIRMLNTKTFYSSLSETLDGRYSASQLKDIIKFAGDDETEIFDAKVVYTNPTEAKKIADAVAEVAPKTISRLNSNAKLKIVDYAEVPSKPSSPNTKKNVMFGFGGGIFIALFISFLTHFMDKRIKYNEEMTALREYPILAAIPVFDTNVSNKNNSAKKKAKR